MAEQEPPAAGHGPPAAGHGLPAAGDGLPAADHAGRRARLRQRLADDGLDALVVTHLVNVRYLTGFTGSSGAVLIAGTDADSLLLTDGRYATQAQAQTPDLAHDIGRGSLAERDTDDGRHPAAGSSR